MATYYDTIELIPFSYYPATLSSDESYVEYASAKNYFNASLYSSYKKTFADRPLAIAFGDNDSIYIRSVNHKDGEEYPYLWGNSSIGNSYASTDISRFLLMLSDSASDPFIFRSTNTDETTIAFGVTLLPSIDHIVVTHDYEYLRVGYPISQLHNPGALTVTLYFVDGTSKVLDDRGLRPYTLTGMNSNTIVEGENEITLTFGNVSTTFTVVGVHEDAIGLVATYTGGEVDACTKLEDLTGITVTAHFEDGTFEIVTGYKLSGTLVAGVNIITVTYGELTTTFEVTAYASIVLKGRDGADTRYKDVASVKLKQSDGSKKTFVACETVEETVQLDFSSGDIEVLPGEGELLSKVTIKMPETLVPGNIAEGVDIAGIVGMLTAKGGGAFATGRISGAQSAPITIQHGLGLIPDLVILFSGYFSASGYITLSVGMSSAFATLLGTTNHHVSIRKNSSGKYEINDLYNSTGIDEVKTTAAPIHEATAESFGLFASTTYKIYSNSRWLAIAGLT